MWYIDMLWSLILCGAAIGGFCFILRKIEGN